MCFVLRFLSNVFSPCAIGRPRQSRYRTEHVQFTQRHCFECTYTASVVQKLGNELPMRMI